MSAGVSPYIQSPVLIPMSSKNRRPGNGFAPSRRLDEAFFTGPTICSHSYTGLVDTISSGSTEISLPVFNSHPIMHCCANRLLGITVGCVVVPQSMAYAKLAELAPEFGLYSSFMGVLIYWFFATSKDITIGVSAARDPSQTCANLIIPSPSPSCLP